MVNVQGYIVGYEDVGEGNYTIDGILQLKDGVYEFLTADSYRQDEPIGIVFVNIQGYVRSTIAINEDISTVLQTNAQVSVNEFEDGEEYTALRSPALRPNCLMRMHYLTNAEREKSVYVRLGIKGTNVGGEDEDYELEILELKKLKDFTDYKYGGKDGSKLMREANQAMLTEAINLRNVLKS